LATSAAKRSRPARPSTDSRAAMSEIDRHLQLIAEASSAWGEMLGGGDDILDVALDMRLPAGAREYLKRSRYMAALGFEYQAAYGPFWQMVDGAIMAVNQTAVVGTTEAALFPVAQYSGWAANQLRAGQLWYLRTVGIGTTPSSSQGNITLTPRYGTSTGGVSLTASAATALAASATNAPWCVEYLFHVRSFGNAGTNATAIGNGSFQTGVALITAATGSAFVFGSTASVSIDLTIAAGLFMGITLGSASDSFVSMASPLSSLN
jgi:hypothetical protein